MFCRCAFGVEKRECKRRRSRFRRTKEKFIFYFLTRRPIETASLFPKAKCSPLPTMR